MFQNHPVWLDPETTPTPSYPPSRLNMALAELSSRREHLARYLESTLDERLFQDVVFAVKNVVTAPSVPAMWAAPIPLPAAPIGLVAGIPPAQGQNQTTPPHHRPNYRPLDEFVVLLAQAAKVRPATLMHAITMLERLRITMLCTAIGSIPSIQHWVLLCALITSSKHLKEGTENVDQWAAWAGNIFDKRDILEMERQFRELLNFHLLVTDQELLEDFFPYIYPEADIRSRVHPQTITWPIDHDDGTSLFASC